MSREEHARAAALARLVRAARRTDDAICAERRLAGWGHVRTTTELRDAQAAERRARTAALKAGLFPELPHRPPNDARVAAAFEVFVQLRDSGAESAASAALAEYYRLLAARDEWRAGQDEGGAR
jgi:hypothetical protein